MNSSLKPSALSNGNATIEQGGYRVLDQYHSQPSKLRAIGVGAGATGLCLAYKMEKILPEGSWDLALYEKNPHLGGTWYENTYPGVACDIPSHIYTYTWDQNPDWSQFFARGDEIKHYFENFAKRHGSEKYIKYNSKVVAGHWDEEAGIWNVTIENTTTKETNTDWCHVLVNGSGILNNWRWPEIPGLHEFSGPLMHSAKWDHTVDFENKVVGVIGTGSTAVQIIPVLQKVAKQVQVYMRSPTWVSPPFGGGVLQNELKRGADDNPAQRQYTFSDEEKQRFREDPGHLLQFRKKIESEINALFGMYFQGSAMSDQFRDVITEEMNRRLGPGHEELKKFIIPKWSPGCRRISPGDGFLEALVEPNVDCITSDIVGVVPEGVTTQDGVTHKIDILVCATGFQVGFKPVFKLVNDKGVSLQEDWGESVNMYLGLCAPRYPNYFTIVGPGATWSNGTLLPSIEISVEYAVKMMKKIQSEQIRSIAVKQDALDDIYAHFDEFHKTTVWKEECRSWFKDGKMKNRIYLWTGPTIHFLKTIKDPRFEDFDIRYRYGNRFAFLGNGQVKASTTEGYGDLAPYIRHGDHEWSIE